MSKPTPAEPTKGKPGKDPFGPPLEEAHVREVFRRLVGRPPAEQEAFIKRVNWNLVDAATELHLMAWLDAALAGPLANFALDTLDRLPHPKRARHVGRFRARLGTLDQVTGKRLQDAFGPVLGGMPKRKASGKATPAAAPKEATEDELQRLKDFFDRFGGGAR